MLPDPQTHTNGQVNYNMNGGHVDININVSLPYSQVLGKNNLSQSFITFITNKMHLAHLPE